LPDLFSDIRRIAAAGLVNGVAAQASSEAFVGGAIRTRFRLFVLAARAVRTVEFTAMQE
jgi:hypothetical protein